MKDTERTIDAIASVLAILRQHYRLSGTGGCCGEKLQWPGGWSVNLALSVCMSMELPPSNTRKSGKGCKTGFLSRTTRKELQKNVGARSKRPVEKNENHQP
jgi:hypothetical protein